MRMLLREFTTLRGALNACDDLSGHFVLDADGCIDLRDLVNGSALYDRGEELHGRSVLVATRDQLTTASTLIELDGIARRIVL